MAKYKSISLEVDARQFNKLRDHPAVFCHNSDDSFAILDRNSFTQPVKIGDWIITDAFGESSVCPDKVFTQTYQRIWESE